MARALLPALMCACAVAAAAAVNYGDYSGVKMPQYGPSDYNAHAAASADDYRDHSPDAPASLDYKYEEESSDKIEKTLPTDVEEDITWKKPVRKHRKKDQKALDTSELEIPNQYKLDDVVPKLKTSYRRHNVGRYRKQSKLRADELLSREISPRYDPDDANPPLEIDDEEISTHQHEDFQENKNLDSDGERYKFVRRETRKKARRKPRDRPMTDPRFQGSDDDDPLNDLMDFPKLHRGSDSEYSDPDVTPQEPPDADRSTRISSRPHSPEGDREYRQRVPLPKPKPMSKGHDYADYYDMKRVQNIKNKLPPLHRRTTARELEPSRTQRFSDPWRKTRPLFNRRKNMPFTTMDDFTTTTVDDTSTVEISVASTTTTVASEATTTTTTPGTNATTTKSPEELSIAEKSRLSILKKAQRKESLKDVSTTKKPPVLFQVTDKMQTVVIVEPPMRQDPWLRAKEISEDSPERLDKVKRLMRHKLVSGAKNIRELTDNWDDLVCDYVDVGMLDANGTRAHRYQSHNPILFTLSVLYVICFN